MKLAVLTAIAALALAPAAFAQNTMSSSDAPMKQGMKSDAKADMGEKKMAGHHRMKHHMRHHRKHHRKAHTAMKADNASMTSDTPAMTTKK